MNIKISITNAYIAGDNCNSVCECRRARGRTHSAGTLFWSLADSSGCVRAVVFKAIFSHSAWRCGVGQSSARVVGAESRWKTFTKTTKSDNYNIWSQRVISRTLYAVYYNILYIYHYYYYVQHLYERTRVINVLISPIFLSCKFRLKFY